LIKNLEELINAGLHRDRLKESGRLNTIMAESSLSTSRAVASVIDRINQV
jgi:hypothetical protein